MEYSYEVTYLAAMEIDAVIHQYGQKFSSGAADFLTAFDDTISRILNMPSAGTPRIDKDMTIRGRLVEADRKSIGYAKRFPYMLIYKVYEMEKKVIIFQLWPTRGGQKIREKPDRT